MQNITVSIQQNQDSFDVIVTLGNELNSPKIQGQLQGQCTVIDNGYVINNTYVHEYSLVKHIIIMQEEHHLLHNLYKPGDYVLYKSHHGAVPVFGIVEAGDQESDQFVNVRFEFDELYRIDAFDLEMVGMQWEP